LPEAPARSLQEATNPMSDQIGEAGAAGSARAWGADERITAAAELTQFISFAIDGDQYGVDIMAVREIKGWSEITHLPRQPNYVRGVLNLRGVIVPIIDLRCRFGQGLTEATMLHVVIIVQIEQQLVGLLADRVSDIISVDPPKIKQVPKVAQSSRLDFLSGIVTIDNVMIALIDLHNLLSRPGDDEPDAKAARIN
jgi:purine-binding chemotaxis protein CheW